RRVKAIHKKFSSLSVQVACWRAIGSRQWPPDSAESIVPCTRFAVTARSQIPVDVRAKRHPRRASACPLSGSFGSRLRRGRGGLDLLFLRYLRRQADQRDQHSIRRGQYLVMIVLRQI